MNKLLLLFILFFSSSFAFAQHAGHNEPSSKNGCGTDALMEELYKLHPELLEKRKESERFYQNEFMRKSKEPAWRSAADVVTIPVVVHVMHLPGTPVGTAENISNAQIEAGILHLNQAFRKQTADFNGIGRNNNIVGADMELEFCLAKQDPNGQLTTGINRIATLLSNLNYPNATNIANLHELSRWDTERYLNIWLVKEVGGGGIGGFAYRSPNHGQPADGIVCLASYFGNSPSDSKVQIHEVGHYFNLLHTFGDIFPLVCTNNNCLTDGDYICDTPPDIARNGSDCNMYINSCTTDTDDIELRNPFRSTSLGGLGDQEDLYENYMDYSSPSCRNTFTQGQKLRMRSALDGDRVLLKTSLGATAPNTLAPLAQFITTRNSINENLAILPFGCVRYIDINIPIKLLIPASIEVRVDISLGSGTASNIADFQLMTPSVYFAIGETTNNAILRVFNDKAIETIETIILDISSATLGVSNFNSIYSFTIVDDDAINNSKSVIYSTDFSDLSDWRFLGDQTDNAFVSGLNGGSCTQGESLYVTNNITTKPNTYSNINSAPAIFRRIDATRYTGLQAKFDYKIGNGRATLRYQNKSRNDIFPNDVSLDPASNVSCSQNYIYNFPTSLDYSLFDFGFAFFTSIGPVNNPSLTIDNLKISANATPVSSAITSVSEYLGPNSLVSFASPTGELLATIQNLSNHDYGCTTVEIDRIGASAVTNAGKKFTSKTFKVTPTTNNATGQNRITLYYLGNEVSGWVSGTGAATSAMSVFKSSGAIGSATSVVEGTNVTAVPFGNSTAFSATFNTGFSGFGIANNVVLAVDLLAFEGIKGNKNVKLRWKTASEKNNDYFVIEKSRDGQIFEDMIKVTSRGSSTDISDYETLDNAPTVGMNYYRLKSVDKGGQIATSKIVSVAFVEKIKLNVYPNPTLSSKINVELTAERDERFDFEVVDIAGKIIHTTTQNVTSGSNIIAFDNMNISKGIYFVRAKQNNIVIEVVRFVRL
jgi:Pregnancy-associated plasma protein-A/Secretion system C-terminal sorting domain